MPMTFQKVLSVALASSQSIHGCVPSYPMALPKSSQFKCSPSPIQLCWGNSSFLQTFLQLLGTSSSWKQVLPEKAETGAALSPPQPLLCSLSAGPCSTEHSGPIFLSVPSVAEVFLVTCHASHQIKIFLIKTQNKHKVIWNMKKHISCMKIWGKKSEQDNNQHWKPVKRTVKHQSNMPYQVKRNIYCY